MKQETKQHLIYVIEQIRNQMAKEIGDSPFILFDLMLCGHMTEQQQIAFINDAVNRGLLPSEFKIEELRQ